MRVSAFSGGSIGRNAESGNILPQESKPGKIRRPFLRRIHAKGHVPGQVYIVITGSGYFSTLFKLFKVRRQGKEQENDPDTEPFGYSANGEVVVLDAGGACRTQQDIANDVNKWRIQNGWTQAKLAEELDVSEKTAGRICRGEKVLNPSEIGILSSLMHKPPGFFITGSHYSIPEEESCDCYKQTQKTAGGKTGSNGKGRPKDREGEDDSEADPEWEEFCMHICSIKDKKERQFWLQVHYGRESLR